MSEFFRDDGLETVFGLTPKMVSDSLSIEKVEEIVRALGADDVINQGDKLIMPTICHNAFDSSKSMKLYYYAESNLFTCYTECSGSFNIYDLVRKVFLQNDEAIGFYEAYNYVLGYINKAQFTVFEPYSAISSRYARKLSNVVLPEYSQSVLRVFRSHPAAEWINEGIKPDTMDKFNIGFSASQMKIIIPHYDLDDRLVGVRGRALNEYEVANYGKYMPVRIEGVWHTHHLSLNLYGANVNKSTIQKTQSAVVFEGEKSCLKMTDYYGDNSNAVAVCGNNLHKVQVDILVKKLGVTDITIAFDKEYDAVGSPEAERYKYKLIALCKKYANYANFFFIYDMNNLLDKKDAPVDQGKEIYERLYDNRVRIR